MTQAVSNTDNQDPFAAAATPAPAAPVDPNADPFASPDEIGGGGPRRPSFEELDGRLVCMKVTSGPDMVPANPQFNQPAGTMVKRYTVSLSVLDTGPLKVFDPNLNGKDQGGFIEFECPFTWAGTYVSQAGLVPKLDGLTPAKPFILGVVRRCPTGSGYKKGETHLDIATKWNAYVVAGKPDRMKPQFSWGLIDATPDQRAVALAWFRGQ